MSPDLAGVGACGQVPGILGRVGGMFVALDRPPARAARLDPENLFDIDGVAA
jgi:hypothetical protein